MRWTTGPGPATLGLVRAWHTLASLGTVLPARLVARMANYQALFFTAALAVALGSAPVRPALAQAYAQPWNGIPIGLDTARASAARRDARRPAAQAVRQVGLTVSDLDRSVDFYTRVLGFTLESEAEVLGAPWERLTGVFGARIRTARLRLGTERLELQEFLAASMPGRPIPVDSRSHDRWFQHVAIIVSDMDSAYRVLRSHRVRHASTGPQLLPHTIPNAAGIRAFYFRDPDGHALEILQFPPDKGDPRWQARDRLFLGIDHTAIVVHDTETSLRFYRDLLGFTVAGASMNFGTEQEHLNNVEGARLRITGLRAPDGGIGVEFLQYLQPRDGRPFPADARANDLLHWHTTVAVRGLSGLARALDRAGAPRISRRGGGGNPEPAEGVLYRDPDGHAVHLVEP